jgi:hypothetical protein
VEVAVDAMTMLKVSAVLFAIAALGGLTMAWIRLGRGINPPTWLAMLHGMLAAAGLTLLAYAAFTVGVPTLALYALALFVIAAIGGAVMNLAYHWRNLPLPTGLLLGHAALAVLGFVLLLLTVYTAGAA